MPPRFFFLGLGAGGVGEGGVSMGGVLAVVVAEDPSSGSWMNGQMSSRYCFVAGDRGSRGLPNAELVEFGSTFVVGSMGVRLSVSKMSVFAPSSPSELSMVNVKTKSSNMEKSWFENMLLER